MAFGGPFLKRLFRHHGSASANYSSPKPRVRLDIFSNGGLGSGGMSPPKSPQKIGVEIIAHRIRGTIVYLPTFGR